MGRGVSIRGIYRAHARSGIAGDARSHALPNLTALETSFRNPPWDPELRWNVPYMHGSTGIVYQNAVSPRPHFVGQSVDPRLARKLTMLDDAPEVNRRVPQEARPFHQFERS